MDIHTCWLMTDCRREQGCIAVAIRWPLSTPCLKMTTLRFSESHSEVFEADGADLTTQIPRQFTAGLHLQVSFTISYISTGLLTSFEPDCEHRLSLDSFADNPHQPICLAARLGAADLLYIYRPVKHHRVRIVPIFRTTV